MWNPVDPETVENPLPFWAWLRKEAPVWEVPDAGYFTVSRYADLVDLPATGLPIGVLQNAHTRTPA